ncbi:MAG: hypothetical protein IJ890_04560 [Clostridia bacterium]|nr:hypothetical protein [Clostridia bacterium]
MIKDKFKRIFISENSKKRIKFFSVLFVLIIIIAFAIFTVMKYEVEGEKEVPFKVGKIIVISSATTETQEKTTEQKDSAEQTETQQEQPQQPTESQENQTAEQQVQQAEQEKEDNYIWNEKVIQTNDICIVLDENKNYKSEQYIKNVKIENIEILENVKLGKIQVYMPNSLDDGLYKYTNDYLVGATLTYTGASSDNKKNLEIGNKGGCIFISFANVGIGEYKSNDDQEIIQGASILKKMNVSNEDLKFKVSFDLVIEAQDKTYKTNIVMDLPIEDLDGENEKGKEITDLNKLIYKRQ